MKRAILVLAVLTLLTAVLLTSCATLTPFTGADYQQIGKVLKPYVAKWGDYGYIEVHLQADRTQAWIGFLWLKEGEAVHALMIGYIGDGWIVVMER